MACQADAPAVSTAARALRWRRRTCSVQAVKQHQAQRHFGPGQPLRWGLSLQPRTTPSVKYSQITRLTQR